jgi:hypothetical protein
VVVRAEVVVLALPPITGTGAPRAVPPSKKVTVPVGKPTVPAAVGVTLAVSNTPWPGLIDVGAAERLVAVGALLTCWRTVFELLELNVPSPE